MPPSREGPFDAALWANIVDDDDVSKATGGVMLADFAKGSCGPFDADHPRLSDLTAELQSLATAAAKAALARLSALPTSLTLRSVSTWT